MSNKSKDKIISLIWGVIYSSIVSGIIYGAYLSDIWYQTSKFRFSIVSDGITTNTSDYSIIDGCLITKENKKFCEQNYKIIDNRYTLR
jgi:hypothetical protein